MRSTIRTSLRLAVASFAAGAGLLSFAAPASAQEEHEPPAMSANTGFKLGLGPTILTPIREGGPWGGGLSLDARYGIKAGPTVVAPGGRAAGYTISGQFIGAAMPTVRWTIPVGPIAPFIVGGLGPGWVSNPSEAGLAILGGGGLMIHFGRVVAIGAEASYQSITGTDFRSLAIGPAIAFGG